MFMPPESVRVEFSSPRFMLDVNIDEVVYPVADWVSRAQIQAELFQDEKLLPLHILMYFLYEKNILTVNGIQVEYDGFARFYAEGKNPSELERGSTSYTLILRRILKELELDVNTDATVSSKTLIGAILKGDPKSSRLVRIYYETQIR